jgi:hypothetical protein
MKTVRIGFLFFILALVCLAAEPLSLAVMGIEPIGTDQETARILEELLLSSLAGRNIFTLMERERVDALLAEIEFQVSGATDASSIAEIGNLLNVQKVLFGSIGRYDTECESSTSNGAPSIRPELSRLPPRPS